MRKILLLLLFVLPVQALAAMAKPPELTAAIHSDAPYGEGTYSWMLIKPYDAALWTDAPAWSWDAPFALSLKYRMHFTNEAITKRSVSEMQAIEPLNEKETAQYTQQLKSLFHDVKDGDVITAFYQPGKGITMYYDGKSMGTIDNDIFARRFLSIWLSPQTSAPSLRKALLKE